MRTRTHKPQCPFCGFDPYEYVNNGVGMEAVDVTCCDLGIAYLKGDREFVEISRAQLDGLAAIADTLRDFIWRTDTDEANPVSFEHIAEKAHEAFRKAMEAS